MARTSRTEWLERVRAWKQSGEARDAFAERHGWKSRSLAWWAWKLESEGEELTPQRGRRSKANTKAKAKAKAKRGGSSSSTRTTRTKATSRPVSPALAFVEVDVGLSPEPGRLELEVGGVMIRLPADFHETSLVRLLSVLEARR